MSDFKIEDRGGIMVLSDGIGCRPATPAEVEFYAEIERLRRELAEAKEIIGRYCGTSEYTEGAEFGVRSCCRVRDYQPHKETCTAWNWMKNQERKP